MYLLRVGVGAGAKCGGNFSCGRGRSVSEWKLDDARDPLDASFASFLAPDPGRDRTRA